MQEASASRSMPTNTARRVQSSSRDLANRRRHAPGFVTMGPKSLSHAEPNGPTARLDLSR